MAVARGLHREAARGGGGKIGRHHGRGAAQEGEGCGPHAAIAQRQEIGQARFTLLDQDLDRVATGGRRLPGSMVLARHALAQRAAAFDALLDRQDMGLLGSSTGKCFNHE
jgi:hypothetical protein